MWNISTKHGLYTRRTVTQSVTVSVGVRQRLTSPPASIKWFKVVHQDYVRVACIGDISQPKTISVTGSTCDSAQSCSRAGRYGDIHFDSIKTDQNTFDDGQILYCITRLFGLMLLDQWFSCPHTACSGRITVCLNVVHPVIAVPLSWYLSWCMSRVISISFASQEYRNFQEVITTINRLNDYIWAKLNQGQGSKIRQKIRIDVNRCCRDVKQMLLMHSECIKKCQRTD